MRAAQTDLRTVADAHKIAAVLVNDHKRGGAQDQCGNHALRDGAVGGKRNDRRHGAENDIVRDQGDEHHGEQQNERELPVQGKRHAEVGGEAFAAAELEIEGEHVPEHAGNARDDAGKYSLGEEIFGKQHRGDGFADVMHAHKDAGLPAHEDHRVRGAGISASACTQVNFFKRGEVGRHVGRADKIADEDDEKIAHNDSPNVALSFAICFA